MTVGIIGAMDMEVDKIKEKIKELEIKTVGKSEFYCGSIDGVNVVLARSGVGKINAAVTTQMMISNLRVDCIINSGIAGAMDSKLSVFDLVISESVACHDVDSALMMRYFPHVWEYKADEKLLNAAKGAAVDICEKYNIKQYSGLIVSGDMFINDSKSKDDIKNRISSLCVEMEGAAVGQACHINNIPFVIIRSISDSGDDSTDMDYDKFAPRAAEISSNLLLGLISALK